MVLNGIGGNTIAEAKSRLSYSEYLTWAAYRRDRGSLNTSRRVEQAVGQLSYITARIAAGSRSTVELLDFLPNEPRPSAEDTMMQAFKTFGGG